MTKMYERIRGVAIRLSKTIGLENLSRKNVADAAGISPGSFTYHTGMRFTEFIESISDEGAVGVAPVTRRRQCRGVQRRSVAHQIQGGIVSGELTRFTFQAIAEYLGMTAVTLRRYVGDKESLTELLLSLDAVKQNPKLAEQIQEA